MTFNWFHNIITRETDLGNFGKGFLELWEKYRNVSGRTHFGKKTAFKFTQN